MSALGNEGSGSRRRSHISPQTGRGTVVIQYQLLFYGNISCNVNIKIQSSDYGVPDILVAKQQLNNSEWINKGHVGGRRPHKKTGKVINGEYSFVCPSYSFS